MDSEPPKKGFLESIVAIAAPAQGLITLVALCALIISGINYARNAAPNLAGTNQLRIEIANNLKSQTESITQLQIQLQNFTDAVELNTKTATVQRNELQTSVEDLTERLVKLEKIISTDLNPSPAIRFFSSGNKIEPLKEGDPIRIGDFVRLTYSYSKLRDCGKSEPDDLLVDINGVIAHFENVSVLDSNGKGLSTPVDPTLRNEITYTARVPANAGLSPGPAVAYVSIIYDPEKCPAIDVIESPRIPFSLAPSLMKKVNN